MAITVLSPFHDGNDSAIPKLVVRGLVADLVSEAVVSAVSDKVRQTVAAVSELLQDKTRREVNLAQLSSFLGLDKSAVSRRVLDSLKDGYLVNRETINGKPARLVIGKSLPDDVEVLPKASTL